MRFRLLAASLAVSAAALGATGAEAGVTELNAALDAMGTYNLIVKGNLNSASGEVEGRTFVGGNVSGPASNYNNDGLSGVGLTVVGDLLDSKKNVRGDIMVGGHADVGVEFSAGSGLTLTYGQSFGNTNVNGNTVVHDAALGATLAAERDTMFANLTELSAYLGGLATTDSFQVLANQVKFDPTSSGEIAVFSLADLSLFANKEVAFTVPANYGLVVVNVTGTDPMSTPGGMNFNGPSGLGAKVIWNFTGLTGSDTLTLNNAWYGSILAVGATASNNTQIEGTMVFAGFDQRGEVHTPGFSDYDFPPPPTAAVPEPSAWAMMILGLGAAGSVLRRRRTALCA